jgi:hypothetical protein
MKSIAILALCVLSIPSAVAAHAEELDEATRQRHKQFEAALSGAKMTGKFTIDGKDTPPKEESYVIEKVTWLDIDDLWRFDVHMKYGDVDKAFALAVPVKWAGETPVISLTKTTIPGMGSFSARVVIDGQRYAGTWDHHGAGGGHMFGKIEKVEKEE